MALYKKQSPWVSHPKFFGGRKIDVNQALSVAKKAYSVGKAVVPYVKKAVSWMKSGFKSKAVAVQRPHRPHTMQARTKPLTRKQLLDIMAVPNTYSGQIGDNVQIPTSQIATGKLCNYSFVNSNQAFPAPFGSLDPYTMNIIGNLINPAGAPNVKFEQTLFRIDHTITNNSNQDLSITAYECQARRDLPSATTAFHNPLYLLGQGFSNTGIDPTHQDSTNLGLVRNDLSPFNSEDFVLAFKIVKTVKKKVKPGHTAKFSITDKKCHVVHPNANDQFAGGQTYGTCSVIVEWKQGESFWLFKMTSETIGVLTADPTQIAFGAMDANIYTTFKYEYKWISDDAVTTTLAVPVRINTGAVSSTLMNPYTLVSNVESKL